MHSSDFFGQGTLIMRPGKQDPRWGRAAWGTGVVQVRVREDLSAQALGVRGGMGGVRTQDPREDGAWACLRRDSGGGGMFSVNFIVVMFTIITSTTTWLKKTDFFKNSLC